MDLQVEKRWSLWASLDGENWDLIYRGPLKHSEAETLMRKGRGWHPELYLKVSEFEGVRL